MSSKTPDTYVIIMAGGVGSRFWPVSREALPKQFLDITNTGKSLLKSTFDRFTKICPRENILIVTNERYRDLIHEQIKGLEDDQILGEPVGRNTAPCVAYVAYKLGKKTKDARMVVAPSDHVIFDEKEFIRVIKKALGAVGNKRKVITIGIKPHKPETGYGYIQYIDKGKGEVKKVKTFTEKPEIDLAETFLKSGDFVWNAGIFVWSLSTILHNLQKHLPELAETFSEIESDYYTKKERTSIERAYSHTKPISIDYGIMEKASEVHVIPAAFGWSDVGSWSALHEISDTDGKGNLIEGNALLFDTEDSIIKVPDEELVVVEGLKGYLVARHGNALLICPKDNERNFRKIYSEVKKKKGPDFL